MNKEHHFVIIGSGFSGVCMGVKLIQAGYYNFTIYEKSEFLGGTWYDNTYPDCGCDVPSILYSYSFELYPEWDRMWAKQRQILQYIEYVVKKYGLESHLQLCTTMKNSVWNEKQNNWNIELTKKGSSFEVTADYLILAVGALHVPQFPNLNGLSKMNGSSIFHGDSFHAAQWNHKVSLVGKKVGIIGSGASAIQIVPEIAKTVKELYVFQRTAPYVFYKTDFEFPTFMKLLFRYVPFLMRIVRWGIFLATESRFSGLYENSLFNWWMKWDALRYMKSIVKDPELQKKITPDYTIGCKRMLFSSFWYPALCRDNVHVITNRLVGVTEKGITVQEDNNSQQQQQLQQQQQQLQQQNLKEIDLDVIVYATGFQLTRDNAPESYKFEVIGRNGTSLNKWHQNGPSTLLGITAPNFPNLFHIYGPNSNLGHNSIIFMIECQTNYVIELLKKSQRNGYKYIEVKEEAVDNFQKSIIQKGMKGKVWNNCVSWYRWPVKKLNPDGTTTTVNSGEIYSMWPHSVVWYYWKTLWPSLNDYINTKI